MTAPTPRPWPTYWFPLSIVAAVASWEATALVYAEPAPLTFHIAAACAGSAAYWARRRRAEARRDRAAAHREALYRRLDDLTGTPPEPP